MKYDDGRKGNRLVPFESVETVTQAQLKILQLDRTRNDLPILERTPKFADYAARFLVNFW